MLNVLVVYNAAVSFFNRAGMQAEQIDFVFFYQAQDRVKMFITVEADPHFYRKPAFYRRTQATEHLINF